MAFVPRDVKPGPLPFDGPVPDGGAIGPAGPAGPTDAGVPLPGGLPALAPQPVARFAGGDGPSAIWADQCNMSPAHPIPIPPDIANCKDLVPMSVPELAARAAR